MLTDGLPAALDWSRAGRELSPKEWHRAVQPDAGDGPQLSAAVTALLEVDLAAERRKDEGKKDREASDDEASQKSSSSEGEFC